MDIWFNLPNGEIATELELTVPVKGKVRITANQAAAFDDLRDYLKDQVDRVAYAYRDDPLRAMLVSVVESHKRVAENAITGAGKVRDDMVSYLRSIVFVLETVVCDHINHSQKNDRLRGCISVIERHVQALREEKFTFTDSMWRVAPDIFHFNETERYLREKIKELQQRLGEKNEKNVVDVKDPEQPF